MDHPAQEQGAARYGLPLRDALDAFSPEDVRAAFYRPPAPTEAEVQGQLAERRRAEEERALRDCDRRVTFERRDWFGRATSRPSPHDEAHRRLAKASQEAAERAFRGAFLGRLRAGELIAHGRAGGIGGAWTRIEPDMWPHLKTQDWKAGAVVSKVKGDATAFYGVRVGWPEAGLSWRNAVLACCEHGKVNHMAGLMADGYPRRGAGFLNSGYSQGKEDEALALWKAAEQRLFGDIRAGRLRVTANDPEKDYAEWQAPPSLGELIRSGLAFIGASSIPPSRLEEVTHLINPDFATDQCLWLSPNGRFIRSLEVREIRVLTTLRVKPGVPVAAPTAVALAEATPPAVIPEPLLAPMKPRRRGGADYRNEDAPLLAEMAELCRAGRAKDAQDAARQVFRKAVGHGSDASKVDRLRKGFSKLYPQHVTKASVEPVEP
ncbi:hypothetical protein MVG78_18290 [Roseomonas gilardii subsp. gilardii]|uniref:hypothetical protein n=1 Tax=Roseomonas gilardii TaxID=257708 RepID=UPI001FF97528|nr:hypothetical protein [Roseomonas gilardii]UPG72418.1 hypothetical protein MVG78_18290 [Roseomonas gilardii subsp. gilardii]